MATTDLVPANRAVPDLDVHVPRKRLKTSDLPLNSVQRSTIDSLLHTIKKKGEYDTLRKKVWSQYIESDDKSTFTALLNELAESETDREPSLLSRDRWKAATLMQGAVDRSDIYKNVEASLDSLIAEHILHIQNAGREIRKAEAGEDTAAEEEKRGNKTDEEYAKESAVRRDARERARKHDEARKRREEERDRLRIEEKTKKLELEKLRSADDRRKEEEAREVKREEEREAKRAIVKQQEEEKELQRRERYERRKREEADREKTRDRSRDRVRSSHRDLSRTKTRHQDPPLVHSSLTPKSREPAPSTPPSLQVDEKALEAAALELLLREGRELAQKSNQNPNPERSESLDPPSLRKLVSKSKLVSPTPPGGEGRRSPVIPLGPKLSFSTTNIASSFAPSRSRSPSSKHRHHDRDRDRDRDRDHHHRDHRDHRDDHRSRSRSRTRRSNTTNHHSNNDSARKLADLEASKAAWKQKAVAQRERDAEAYKRNSGAAAPRSRSGTRERERSRHHRSHSRGRGEREERGDGDRERDRGNYRERDRDIRGGSDRRTTNRDKSPVEIDRYVPSGGSAAGGRGRERDHGRRDRGGEHRDRDRDRDGRERDGRDAREEKGYSRGYVEIDRYVPSGGGGDEGKKRAGDRERRERERGGSR